jgi:hypothetical protein
MRHSVPRTNSDYPILLACFLGGLGPRSSKRNWFRSLEADESLGRIGGFSELNRVHCFTVAVF